MPLEYQDLCELADREIQLEAVDDAVMDRARIEANGVTAHAHQIYWRLRAGAIQEEVKKTSEESCVRILKARLDAEEKKRKRRREFRAWMWALLCFASLAGAYVFPRIALAVLHRGTWAFYVCGLMGVVCLFLIGVAYTASKRHARNE